MEKSEDSLFFIKVHVDENRESLEKSEDSLFFIKVHVYENNIEMSTSRPRKFKMWTRK